MTIINFEEEPTMQHQKMIKMAKVLGKVFGILQRLTVLCAAVAMILLSVFTIVNAVNPDFIAGADLGSVHIGALTFAFSGGMMPNAILIYVWIMVVGAIAYIAVLYYVLGVFRRILKPMADGNPFAPFVSDEIRKLAFSGLAIGVISNLMTFMETLAAVRIFDLSSLLQSSQVQNVSVNFHFDATFVILFFVLLLVSYIFRYGEELQKLSDETL